MGRRISNAKACQRIVAIREEWLGRIHQCDCVQTLSQIADGGVHLAFADPPFNIGYEHDEYDGRLDSEENIEWSTAWIAQVHRVLSPVGAF